MASPVDQTHDKAVKGRHSNGRVMRDRVAAWVALFGCLAASPAAAQPQALDLTVGQAHVLNEPGVRRIVVGNGKVIQATALDGRQILIIPEAVGRSSLHLWTQSGPPREWSVNVQNGEGQRTLSEIQGVLGTEEGIRTRLVADKVVVDATALNEDQARRVSEMARRFPQVVDLSSKVAVERMISIDVRMVEVRREAMKNLGIKWNGSGQGPSFGLFADLHRSSRLQPGGLAESIAGLEVRPRVLPFMSYASFATNFTSMLNLMVQNGDAVVLAEPQLSCRSGGSARLVAGGELPIPVSSGLGATSVMFKEYGVKFDINPVAADNGLISARIATEISAINFDVMVREIPGLTKRRAETEVNLRENETLVVAGLVSEETSSQADRLAGLGDLPILGALFRSRSFRERKTELVVFMTPRLVSAEHPQNRERLGRGQSLINIHREALKVIE